MRRLATTLALAASVLWTAAAHANFQFVVSGPVIAVRPDVNAIVVRDRKSGNLATIFVHPKVVEKLDQGKEVTAAMAPGNPVAQSLDVKK